MSNSRRFHSIDPEPTPSPYPFHDKARKQRFLDLVRQHLGRNGDLVTISDGVARVAGSPIHHGLTNLAQSCNLAPEADWPHLVAEHLEKSNDARLATAAASLIGGGLQQNLDRLVVRIYPHDHFQGPLRDHFVQRTDLETTLTVLAIDVGPSILPVQRLVAESWGVPHATLFAKAIENITRTSTARWSRLSIPPTHDFGFDLLHGDFHAATHILREDPGLPRCGREGNLIGIPACGTMFSYALDAPLDALTIQSLTAISLGKCHDGPNAITPHLFWRAPDGRLHIQRAQRLGRGTRFLPSPEFVECMVRLQKRGGGGGS